ncbi:AMP-binding protein [Halorarius halobius]|uniref:AMP-binding protein n=1 Tax=Halorarius halobius TaxID=2962671 RepID=UPI0020CF32F5|nr:AMP-binding protein [Halorarius halobius]
MTADLRETPTVHGLLRGAVDRYADRELARVDGETVTYGEAWERGGRLARALAERGIEPGDRVGVVMSNQLAYLTANLACVRGGFVNVPMNDMLTPEEFRYMFADSGARAAVVGAGFTDTVADLAPELPALDTVVAVSEDPPEGQQPLDRLLADHPPEPETPDPEPDDLLRLSYTGGTTGKPKGARHTHGILGMNMLAHVAACEIRDGEEMLVMTPLPHAAGYIHLAAMLQGARLTVTQGFDPETFLRLVDEEPITWAFLVPTMLYRVLDHEALDQRDVSGLETVLYGAAPITQERLAAALETFGDVFVQLYGQTEMPDVGMVLPKRDHVVGEPQMDSCGAPAAMVEAGIADPSVESTVDLLPRGEVGELVMRSPYVMDGYHGKPEKTESTLVDGWLRTGDIARRDEAGYVYLLDRANDMIISGGMNVYTTEVEDALDAHPAVQQVAVIGVPDDDWGEAVHAVVVADGDPTEDDLVAFAGERLADYKKPKSVEFVDEIPTTPYGKMDKKALREPYWEDADREIN